MKIEIFRSPSLNSVFELYVTDLNDLKQIEHFCRIGRYNHDKHPRMHRIFAYKHFAFEEER